MQTGEITLNDSIVNTTSYHPYLPVFSSIVSHGAASFHNINWGITYQNAAGFSAGVNCNGLTQQAASYQGNNYVYENLGERLNWDANYGGAYPVNEGGVDRVWYLWEEDNQTPYGISRNLIVPGDMFIQPGVHTGVIQSIVFREDARVVLNGETTVIEAASPDYDYKIINDRDLSLQINIGNTKIVRLKTE